jgi:3-deoxy-D-manno-octulosonate 8-phosphate phosphatase (KDO 8-P phosphatase)|tara:strand:+ start:1161 stop:1706 length:546 start_codon:yes stop_codon:yes gene_type:complete
MSKIKNIKGLFAKVKLLILDVDGVLTGGEIIYDDEGRELKIFNVKDGLGIFLLGRLGIKTILLSARNSPVLKKRAKDMRVAEVLGGVMPKEKVLSGIEKKYKVKASEICFIGDDLIDIGIMKRIGCSVAVGDAHKQVKNISNYVTTKHGGQGAVREIIDLIIKHKGLEKRLVKILENPKKG